MNPILKLTFISGLLEVVKAEAASHTVISESHNSLYLEMPQNIKTILSLKSINSAYAVVRDGKYNPRYLHKHKSLLGNLIELAIAQNPKAFTTFKLRCAGSQTQEIKEIEKYIVDTYRLTKAEDASLEIYISKIEQVWEISVRLSPRPLSVREYKVSNIKGGLNPNIAYAMNSFCRLDSIDSYLNIFSGSATLLIEAGTVNPKIKLLGVDMDKKTNSLAIQNIKKAGLIQNIQIKTADIYDNPDFGTFDSITCNLPFGMQISKGEDLSKLYRHVVEYSEKHLSPNGTLVLYTSEHDILQAILTHSKFKVANTLDLMIPTNANSYLYPKIFVCNLV